MNPILASAGHRPFPLPGRPWTMTQRWNDLLFAHWPIPAAKMTALLPPGLEADTYDGAAWLGVVPFWMDRIRTRLPGSEQRSLGIPTARTFPELNLRTYVRSRHTGLAGVYFFSLDAASPLAVLGARTLFHLPYFVARMSRTTAPDGAVTYRSHRQWHGPDFAATYRPRGEAAPAQPGTLPHFLTERYCLFTTHRGRVLIGNIHHLPWSLAPAEAAIEINQLPRAHGLTLPEQPPLLHFSRTLEVYVWSLTDETATDETGAAASV